MSSQGQTEEINRRLSTIAVGRTSVTSIGANENLFAVDLTPLFPAGQFRCLASFAQVGRVSVIANTGTNTFAMGVLTETATLVANEGYAFDFPVRQDWSYNFQYTAAGSLNVFSVDEIA